MRRILSLRSVSDTVDWDTSSMSAMSVCLAPSSESSTIFLRRSSLDILPAST